MRARRPSGLSLGEAWPTINGLRGKIIVGLTGQETTSSRRAYVRDQGQSPAVAMNDLGQVIEVHKSEVTNTLWYWTGQMQEDGTIIWKHHGRYDDGRNPTIALNNHGWFVEVHRSQSDDDLWSWVGHIGLDGDLHFGENVEFDEGRIPSVRFIDRDGWDVREVHRSSSEDDQNWVWDATIDAGESRVLWGDHGRTDDERFESDRATSSAGTVSVFSEDRLDDDTLLYGTDAIADGLIRYAQVAFIDTSPGDPDVLSESSDFRSFPSGRHTDASTWRSRGGIARMWKFDEDDADAMGLPPQFAATDTPFEDWYLSWGESVGAYD